MKKKLAIVAGALVAIILGAAIVIAFSIDAIARSAVEKGSTYALGVNTTLQKADVGITSGSFSMSGLNVANPEGFTTPHFLDLRDAGVHVSLATLRQETVRLVTLRFDGLDVNIERKGSSTNVHAILDNLKRFESEDEPTRKSEGGGKKFIIAEVDIRDVAIHVESIPLGAQTTRIDLPIDRIQLKNVGSDSDGGVLLSELTNIIVKAILAAAVENGGDLIPSEIMNDITGQLAQLENLESVGAELLAGAEGSLTDITDKANDLGKDMAGQLQKGADDLGRAAEEAADEIGRNIGNLLGGDRNKDKDEN